MSNCAKRQKMQDKLQQRQKAFDALPLDVQRGRRRPGSMNPRKQT